MKKLILTIIVLCVCILIYFKVFQGQPVSKKVSFIKFYKSLPVDGFKFSLYSLENSPISNKTIKTLDESYVDLIEFGKNSNYKIKIPQMQHETAMEELRLFYDFVKSMKDCGDTVANDLSVVCENDQVKPSNLMKYIEAQISDNAKIPYKNKKEYFYLNYKTIMSEAKRNKLDD